MLTPKMYFTKDQSRLVNICKRESTFYD
jgi:hypothetical protein